MAITYNPLLVLLSIVIAVQASYVGLRLTMQVPDARGLPRRLLLTGASLSLAMGIWGMHFVGMLAARLPTGAQYQVLPTLISFLVCVLVVGFAIVGASLWPKTVPVLLGTAVVMGLGIATMHYVGMMALHDSLHMRHDPAYVAASILAAVAASAASLWLATMARRRPPLILCATLLGMAISSMHYTAMAGTTIEAMAGTATDDSPRLSPDLMAIVVAVVAFIISAVFLLTLVPEPKPRASAARADAKALLPVPGTDRPGAPADRASATGAQHLPVERQGRKILIAPEDVYAVRANAHYSYVFDGQEDLFCSLSIGEAENYLGKKDFARVHRSHIVNLRRVAGVRKTSDGGFADIEGARKISIPLSRAKVNELRNRFLDREI